MPSSTTTTTKCDSCKRVEVTDTAGPPDTWVTLVVKVLYHKTATAELFMCPDCWPLLGVNTVLEHMMKVWR